jgi:hypothetical protein
MSKGPTTAAQVFDAAEKLNDDPVYVKQVQATADRLAAAKKESAKK